MKARDFLRQPKEIDCRIANKLIEKEQWKSMATSTTAHSNGDRVQSSGSQQKMADAVVRYICIEQEIDQFIDQLVDIKKDVISVIEQLSLEEYDLLHKVYVQYIELYDVSEICGKPYGYDSIKKIHAKGIKHVQEILDRREVET